MFGLRLSVAPLVFGVLFLTGGCSSEASSPKLSASDSAFEGLPSEVVREVLDSPAAKERVTGDNEATARLHYQGMVLNFSGCRSALKVYQTWVATGTAPSFPAQARPKNPLLSADDVDREVIQYKKFIASGDISQLRNDLINESGCGVWIPAKPGDVTGPTIADVVKGKG